MKIKNYFLEFDSLAARTSTRRIVIHHTGVDLDADAKTIHRWHLDLGYSGIGYHYVIRQNGSVEQGRPSWAIGAHAYGANADSIGIHFSGNFDLYEPTLYQIESAALLISNLCKKFNIPIDRKHILGHRELDATACPGNFLFNRLDELSGKANWYSNF